jgi:heme oxygenase (mycobilin-producing)
MYVSLSRLRVPEERAEELVCAFRRRAGLVDRFDGFVDLQVWQNDRDPGELTMVSRWRDRDCFKTYMKSRDHQVSHARIDPDLDAAIKLERLEHLHVVAQ